MFEYLMGIAPVELQDIIKALPSIDLNKQDNTVIFNELLAMVKNGYSIDKILFVCFIRQDRHKIYKDIVQASQA